MIESRFPVLDFDRFDDPDLGGSRVVFDETLIEPAVDETGGQWIAMPVRSAFDAMGPRFEIGPYSLTDDDIARLHNALLAHIKAFPDDFKRANGDPV
ncbi:MULTISPECIES: hypothetical protein [Rhodococcus]|nr:MULTISPECIES: hypothetical protein [Rhodococcus]BDB58974.1 hypothetical protein RDE2_07680 [Rhodococcus sp. RDE2]